MDERMQKEGDPLWLTLAMSHLGCQELMPDGKLNPKVRAFFQVTSFPASLINSRTAWCAAFLCSMLEEAGYRSPRSAAAKSFLPYGRELVKPRRGAILVFTRGAADAATGHVGLYLGEGPSDFLVLGGNQRNCVGAARYSRERLQAIRWPTDKLKGGPPIGSRAA